MEARGRLVPLAYTYSSALLDRRGDRPVPSPGLLRVAGAAESALVPGRGRIPEGAPGPLQVCRGQLVASQDLAELGRGPFVKATQQRQAVGSRRQPRKEGDQGWIGRQAAGNGCAVVRGACAQNEPGALEAQARALAFLSFQAAQEE